MDRFRQTRNGRIRRGLVTLLLFSLGELLWGQTLQWSVSPILPKEGEPFTLTVRIPRMIRTEDAASVQNRSDPLPPGELVPQKDVFFPPALQLFKGPIVQTRRERVEGRLTEFIVVSYVFVSRKAGRFRLDPFRVQWGDRSYGIGPLLLEIAGKDPPYRVPFELDWVLPTGPFYVGQAIPLKLVAMDLEELPSPESVEVKATPGSILESVPSLSGTEPGTKEGWALSTIGQYIYTPLDSGVQLLPSATVKISEVERRIEGKQVSVLPLPEPVRATGAVGSFSVLANLEDTVLQMGSSTLLHIRIEGVGNLHWWKIPPIEGTDFSLIQEGRRSHYRSSWKGYEGWVEETYRVFPLRTGALTLQLPVMLAWDPFLQQVSKLPLPPLTLEVRPPGSREQGPTVIPESLDLEELPRDFRTSGWTRWLQDPRSYILFLPVFLSFLGNRVWRRSKYLPYLIGWGLYAGTMLLPFEGIAHSKPVEASAVTAYNEGVRYAREGRWGEALFHLRKAVYLSPEPVFREAVRKVQNRGAQGFHAPLPHTVPDHWFLVGIGALHLVAMGFLLIRKSQGRALILGIGVSGLLLAGIFLYHSLQELKRPWAVVVSPDAVLHRIPSPVAQDWIPLPEGSSFFVKGERDEYIHVYLGGVEGWVGKNTLRME
ncbi:MAG: hypothetical protein Kow009_01120 [Spirochaetales bacterium]